MPKNDTVQIVVPGVPRDLATRLEKIAKREKRSRVAQIRLMLEEVVDERERELAAHPKAA